MKKIIIDAGHGGNDSGALGQELKEKDINLSVALKVKDLLKIQEIDVILTRETDKTLSLEQRVVISNNNKVDAFISIHCNSFNKSAKGIETYSSATTTRDLADKVHKRLLESKCYTLDRKVKHSAFYVIKNTKARACLIELGFIDNAEDAKILKEKQDELAIAVSKGVCDFLGVVYKESVNKMYKVCVGAFKDRDNAVKIKNEAIAKGFQDTYMLYE